MSKNVKVNDKTYSGVSIVELPLASGSGKAQFKDVDEITTPSGYVTITENGTHDVTNYASAVVNVASEGGGAGEALPFGSYKYGTFTLEEAVPADGTFEIEIGWETKPRFFAWLKTDGYTGIPSYHVYGFCGYYSVSGSDEAGWEYFGSGFGMSANNERNSGPKYTFYKDGTMTVTANNTFPAGTYGWIAIGD